MDVPLSSEENQRRRRLQKMQRRFEHITKANKRLLCYFCVHLLWTRCAVLSFGLFHSFIIASLFCCWPYFLRVFSSSCSSANEAQRVGQEKNANANIRIPNENNEMHQKLRVFSSFSVPQHYLKVP